VFSSSSLSSTSAALSAAATSSFAILRLFKDSHLDYLHKPQLAA